MTEGNTEIRTEEQKEGHRDRQKDIQKDKRTFASLCTIIKSDFCVSLCPFVSKIEDQRSKWTKRTKTKAIFRLRSKQ